MRACVEASDSALVNGASPGPAAITAGCPTLAATRNLQVDAPQAVWTLSRDRLAKSCWIANPVTWA